MAVYAISKEGLEDLRQLAADLSGLNNNMEQCGVVLENKITGIGDELGIYAEEITEIVQKINRTKDKVGGQIVLLVGKVNETAQNVEVLVSSGLV